MSSTKVTKCTSCTKLFHEGQNAIQCDKCDGWLHLKCSGLKQKEFKNISEETEFVCKFCINFQCGKCEKPVYSHQNSIECSIEGCSTWFHLRCTPFTQAEYLDRKSRLHTQPWYYPNCTMIPFNGTKNQDMCQLVNDDMHLREYFNVLTCNDAFNHKCSVCC